MAVEIISLSMSWLKNISLHVTAKEHSDKHTLTSMSTTESLSLTGSLSMTIGLLQPDDL